MKSIRRMTLAAVLATSLAMFTLNTTAQQSGGGESSVKGKVTSVDKSSQTIMIDGRSFQLLPTTRVTSNDQQVSIDNIKTGQQVSGQYKQSAENKMELTSLEVSQSVGGTSDGSSGESGKNFSGKVSRVDTSSQTLTIGGQTYQILPTTRITKNDQQASISDLKAGTQVSGQYKKSAENNMEVLTLDISPAVGGTSDNTTGGTSGESGGGSKFSGKVSNVDMTRQRVTIGNRTYQMLPTSTLTLPNGKQTTLTNLKPNQQVTGTYKESSSGNFEILSIQVVGSPRNPD
jgi:predicted RNA-binding protein